MTAIPFLKPEASEKQASLCKAAEFLSVRRKIAVSGAGGAGWWSGAGRSATQGGLLVVCGGECGAGWCDC